MLLGSCAALAQTPTLTPEEAVQLALKHNFSIQIAEKNANIAKANNTQGNAGMLPTINLVANDNFTLSTFQQQLSNGNEFNARGATFNNANLGVQLAWTLFDGKRMYVTKDRLQAQEKLGNLQFQAQIVRTSAEVLLAFHEIVKSNQQELAIKEVIALNQEQLRIAEARVAAGFANQTDILTAKLDLNQRKADLLNQQNNTNTTKANLNVLIGRPFDTEFEVLDNNQDYQPDGPALTTASLTQNIDIKVLEQALIVTNLTAKETNLLNKVRINNITQINALRTDNGAGFLLNNTQAGIILGLNLVYPLYTAGNYNRQVEVAKLQQQQATLQLKSEQQNIPAALNRHLQHFYTQTKILQLENENLLSARDNLNISTERFRLGQTSGLETQIARNTLEQTLLRINIARFNLKVAEINLKLFSGTL
jgi:outer membrane protein TolC